MSTYLLLNILIILVPLLLSFESKIKYYTKYLNLISSIFLVASVFIIWDSYAAIRGDWYFNEKFVLSYRIFKLPVEEILFFITVPYSILFLYETAKIYIKNTEIIYGKNFYYLLSFLFIVASLFFISKYYTFTVLIFTGISFLFLNTFTPQLLRSKIFWQLIVFSYIPFFVFNYLFTSLPIIEYGATAIVGIRIITIPIEDFFYSFSLLSLYISLYELSFKVWEKKQ